MSKVTRIVLAVLIGLGIIAAMSTNVQASLGSMFVQADTNNVNADVFLDSDVLGRTSMNARGGAYYQFESLDPGSGHGCESKQSTDD